MSIPDFDEQVPFVPAYDLLEAPAGRISDSDLAAIGLALAKLLPSQEREEESAWKSQARTDAISCRI